MNRRVLIDLDALRDNYRVLQERAAPAECGAVVKSDAYGLGAIECSRALYAAGCRKFFVATLEEAVPLRDEFADIELYALEGLEPERRAEFVAARIWPVLNSLEQVRAWAGAGDDAHCLVHIDSGMNRLGMTRAEVEALAADRDLLGALTVDYVITHLGCSDEPAHEQNVRQLERFDELRALLPPHKTSIASSPGVFLASEHHGDLARPGISLYGGRPDVGPGNPMREVAKVQGRIVQIREVEDDAYVGYGATEAVAAGSKLATIAFGYADGYPRSLSSKGRVRIGDYVAKVIGRVSMDVTVVDISDAREGSISVGDWATLIGDGIDLDDVAEAAGTISYELLNRIGRRVERVY
ncbi:MAG: alanine racemase [Woeseiaceae bacterium]|nr:alanine racemase [Woeseiaceae bacterium]